MADDDDALRAALSDEFRRAGIHVDEARNGLEVLARVAWRAPTALLLDVRMPGASGLEAMARMRERHIDVPTVVLTSFADEEVRRAALASGARAVLDKPVDIDALRAVLLPLLEEGHATSLMGASDLRTRAR